MLLLSLYRTLKYFNLLPRRNKNQKFFLPHSFNHFFSSRFCLLLLIFFPTLHFPSLAPKKLFFLHRKNAQFFFIRVREHFLQIQWIFLERQLHSGCVRSKKSSVNTKREWKGSFFAWQTVCAKKRFKRDHDLLTKRTVAISI